MISDFVRLRGMDVLSPREIEQLRAYLVNLFHSDGRVPAQGAGINWREMAFACGIEPEVLLRARDRLRPGVEALRRELRKPSPRRASSSSLAAAPPKRAPGREPSPPRPVPRPASCASAEAVHNADPAPVARPSQFHGAFEAELRRNGETLAGLRKSLAEAGLNVEYSTLRMWRLGLKAPAYSDSLAVLVSNSTQSGPPYRRLKGTPPALRRHPDLRTAADRRRGAEPPIAQSLAAG